MIRAALLMAMIWSFGVMQANDADAQAFGEYGRAVGNVPRGGPNYGGGSRGGLPKEEAGTALTTSLLCKRSENKNTGVCLSFPPSVFSPSLCLYISPLFSSFLSSSSSSLSLFFSVFLFDVKKDEGS